MPGQALAKERALWVGGQSNNASVCSYFSFWSSSLFSLLGTNGFKVYDAGLGLREDRLLVAAKADISDAKKPALPCNAESFLRREESPQRDFGRERECIFAAFSVLAMGDKGRRRKGGGGLLL